MIWISVEEELPGGCLPVLTVNKKVLFELLNMHSTKKNGGKFLR